MAADMTQTSEIRLAQLPPWEGGKGVESEAKTKHVTKVLQDTRSSCVCSCVEFDNRDLPRQP